MQKLFIVEDNKEYANLLRHALRSEFKIHMFETAEECLKVLHASKPDLFIIDYYLPGMNGLELFEQLMNSEATKDKKIIMLSGVDDGKLILDFIKKGVRDYVIKDDNVIKSLKAVINDDDETYFDIAFND